MSVTFQLQRIRKKKKKRKGMDKMNTESDQTKPVKEKKSVVENDKRTVVTTKTTTIRVVTLKFLWHFTFLSLIIENFNEKHRIYSKFISLRSNKKKTFFMMSLIADRHSRFFRPIEIVFLASMVLRFNFHTSRHAY